MSYADQACPCGRSATYADCCQMLHLGKVRAQTAVQLMRARYSAYALKLIEYLLETTHPDKHTTDLRRSISDWAAQSEFYRLEILATRQGQATDKIGKVEFIASYHRQGQEQRLRELSRFKRYRKQWVYLDGEIAS